MSLLPQTTPAWQHHRYRLLAPIGAGGMGAVYRAYDRLTGQTVALKQVQVAPQTLAFASRPTTNDTQGLLLALAQEFKLLASLRHPHIISVLDYGFDANRQPYFTMELLEEPQTLLEAGRGQPLNVQVDLLIQTLQALAYLHRRGILHRDLKPENVLVSGRRVRVLDFGLAIVREQARRGDESGTLLYLPPELQEGAAHSEAADLYTMGILSYEMLVGCHPFYSADLQEFLDRVWQSKPNLTPLAAFTAPGAPVTLTAVLERLLARQPAARYPAADAVIVDLCLALGQPLPPENSAIRESFLQAATFVGREQELAHLTAALDQARQGQGSLWLIGGESGVGKSRLMDEVRTQALVCGALVLRGQGIEGGGLPYQLWRDPLRQLALSTTLSDLEASVLQPLIPDIDTLLARTIAGAPFLNGIENTQRLSWVITNLLRRQTEPLLIIFEDLHWADESLDLLGAIAPLVTAHPIVILGSYRNDERPHLPSVLPTAQRLSLGRLSEDSIVQLSSAMLGERGKQPQIVALLQRETEGNTFFMVEVMRALAEESGSLAGIGVVTLPAHVFTGGVQRLVMRRLQRIPVSDFPLLQLAAVMGRQIDQPALRVLPELDLEGWLLRCADAVVLEVQAEGWRFAHDKLREGVLQQLTPPQRLLLHQQAARCIEQAYAADLSPHAGRLTDHYHQAGDADHERRYARQAGDYAVATFAHAEALRYYQRALALTDDALPRFSLLLACEEILDWRGERAAQTADLETLQQIAEHLADDELRIEVALRQVRQLESLGDLSATIARAQQALAMSQRIGNGSAESRARLHWGIALSRQADFAGAQTQLTPALALAEAAGRRDLIADCLLHLGDASNMQGDAVTGQRLLQQSLQISQEIDDLQRQFVALHDLSIGLYASGDLLASDRYLEEALHLSRRLGRPYDESLALINLAVSAREQGNYDLADQRNAQALQLARMSQSHLLECYALGNRGGLYMELGDFAGAEALLGQALELAQRLGAYSEESIVLNRLSKLALIGEQAEAAERYARAALELAQTINLTLENGCAQIMLGRIALYTHDFAAAAENFTMAINLLRTLTNCPAVIDALAGLAEVYMAQNQLSQAEACVDEILAWQTAHPLLYLYDWASAYLTCYRVLAHHQRARATSVLARGYQLIQRRAATLSDPSRQQDYRQKIRANRELIATWEARRQTV